MDFAHHVTVQDKYSFKESANNATQIVWIVQILRLIVQAAPLTTTFNPLQPLVW